MEVERSAGDIVGTETSRYRLVRALGRGAFAVTYEAEDLKGGALVALKILDVRAMGAWKELARFEREASVLRGLDHPSIPRYVAHFAVEAEGLFCLAQEIAPGVSVADRVERGRRPDIAEVRKLLRSGLEVLTYLHTRLPPVVHRDVSPRNVVVTDDGRVSLVDFGAAQPTSSQTTVMGTPGYAAPEQILGHAVPASDLYGLGMTLLHLVTHESASALLGPSLSVDVSRYLGSDPVLAGVIQRMVAPLAPDRFATAVEALAALDADATQPSDPAARPGRGRAVLVLGAAVAVVLGISGAVAAYRSPAREYDRPPPYDTPTRDAIFRSDPSGCADGSREGFRDRDAYPDIAGCSGAWSGRGVPIAGTLCAAGFHLCRGAADVAKKSATGCRGATSPGDPPRFFVTAQRGPGDRRCTGSGGNDLFGCGNHGDAPGDGCGVLDRFSNNLCEALGPEWSCGNDGFHEFDNATKTAEGGGGALCCRDD